jgi:hypothetical protein
MELAPQICTEHASQTQMPARAVSSGAPNTRLKFGSRSLFKFSVRNCPLFGQLEVPVRGFFDCENEEKPVQGALGAASNS